jgi:hypothetical protein
MALLYGPAARVAIPASMPIRQGGRFASLDVMGPCETRSRNTMAPNAHINSDVGDCANGGSARHGGAPAPDKPPTHSESRWGRERGRSIPFASFRCDAEFDRYRGIADSREPSARRI